MTIERTAKAIAEHMFPWPDDFDEYLLGKYQDCARAALESIAEPTPGMIEAGSKKISDHVKYYGDALPDVIAVGVWCAMHAAMMKW